MNKFRFLLTVLVVSICSVHRARADVEINETNFPDENFRSYLLGRSYGSDAVITEDEMAQITRLTVVRLNIASLKGIEFFTSLTELRCNGNQLTSLDVSKNTVLSTLDCYNNQLTSLDVSKNTALSTLHCFNNQLTSLDVSMNTALTILQCYSNQLTTLDVSACRALKTLSCFSNQIKGTAMSALIKSLPTKASGDNDLSVIYSENEGNVMTTNQVAVVKAKGWTPRYFDNTQSNWLEYAGSAPDSDAAAGVEINETNFPDENFRKYLLLMDGSDGVLTDEEIANVTSIYVRSKSIASLQGIEFFTALTFLNCTDNQLTSLDVSKNTALTNLMCRNNQLTSLDVSMNTALMELDCFNNQLTALNVQSTVLKRLNCSNNKLTSLIVSNSFPYDLDCSSNQIKGAAMDAFIASLSQSYYGVLKIINPENEGNEMTKAQVAAAKAKGWTPAYRSGSAWMEYTGSDPAAIEPIAEETTVSFGGTSGVDESTDLSNTAVHDVLFTLDHTAGNGYDNTDQSITITSVVSDADIAAAESLTPGTAEFAEKFNGITIELPAGTCSVTFDCQTIGYRALTVKMSNAPIATYTKPVRGEVKVAYNVAAPTYLYIYATAVAGARDSEPTAIENALKLYGFTVKPGDTTGINAINSDKALDGSDVYFDLSGRHVMTPQKGIYVKNGRKVVVK